MERVKKGKQHQNNIKIISKEYYGKKSKIHICKFTAETEGQGEDLQGLVEHRNRQHSPREKVNYSDIPMVISSHKDIYESLGKLNLLSSDIHEAAFPLASAINPTEASIKKRILISLLQ